MAETFNSVTNSLDIMSTATTVNLQSVNKKSPDYSWKKHAHSTSDFLLAANISFTVSKQKKHAANTLQVKHVLWKQDDYVIMVKFRTRSSVVFHHLYYNSESILLSFIANKYPDIMFLHVSH